MSNALVAMIIVALMITAGMMFSKTAIDSVDSITESWKQSMETDQQISGTDIKIIAVQASSGEVNVAVQNTGRIQLLNFSEWDVFVHYYSQTGTYSIRQPAYTASTPPGANEWTVSQIYTDQTQTQKEVFQPGILDPGEVADLQMDLSPAPGAGTTGWIVISTDDGVTASVQFQD